ncbi:MAG: hypothetical protein IJC09_04150, partial [Clostridia bacterium]|nr:hypothetical protein [Clostridia bacterium]
GSNNNAGFAHQDIGGGSTFENCYVAEVTVLYNRSTYSFGSDSMSDVTATNCWSTLTAIEGTNYNDERAFGEYVADKDTLVSKFEGVEGWTTSEDVNGGYPCLAWEVPEVVVTPTPEATATPTPAPTATPTPNNYAGGSGTEADPYLISNATQLAYANEQINSDETAAAASYKLTADIDYADAEWTPLGWKRAKAYGTAIEYTPGFSGTFDGNGHVIRNLKITKDSTAQIGEYMGFFGYVSGKVSNLGIDGIEIVFSNHDYVYDTEDNKSIRVIYSGGMVGMASGATFTNCYVANSKVHNSNRWTNDYGLGGFAGILGANNTFTNCYVYNTAIAAGHEAVQGGFYGDIGGTGSVLSNCYAAKIETGLNTVTARTYGFGRKTSSYTPNVTNCYSTLNNAKSTYTSAPAFDATLSMGETGMTAETITLAAVSSGAFTESNGYPELDITPTNGYAGGNGTKYNPYQIGKASQLAYANKQINAGVDNDKFFILTDDIDYNNGEWEPLGSSDATMFSGGFDGNGHTVSNLSIYNESSETPYTYIGFFGLVDDAKITNLGVENFNISAYNTNKVISAIGGFVGYVQGATTITNCFIKNSSVVQRWNFGPVSNGFGGFIGTARRTQGDSGDEVPQIKNCYVYNTTINGGVQKSVAGFIGSLYNNEAVALTNCYADINVEDDTISVYGFGAQSTYGTYNQVNNCYSTFAGQDGTSEYAGTYTPANSYGNVGASMQNIRTALAGTGFEMTADINDGYPYLAYETAGDDVGYVVPDFMVKSVKPGIGTENADKVTVAVSRKSGVTDAVKAYVAGYDLDGRLVGAGSASVNLDDFEFIADIALSKATTVKVFVWDETLNPASNSFTAVTAVSCSQLGEEATSTGVERAPRLVLMGDSLMDSVWNTSDGVENKSGWEAYIGNYMSDDLTLVKHGHSGQTIKMFVDGRSTYHTCSWETIKTEFGMGDYVIIALGTNDNNYIANGEYTVTEFKDMYKDIIADVKAKGAKIILLTPPTANWHYNASTGKFSSDNVFETARQALISVGLETNTPAIDMGEAFTDAINNYIETSGKDGKEMCVTYEDGVITKSGVIFVDSVHFTAFGADLLAKTVAEQIALKTTGLEDYVTITE